MTMEIQKQKGGYSLVQDNDCNDFIIPWNKRKEFFDKWVQDEDNWDVPSYAIEVNTNKLIILNFVVLK